MSREHEFSHFHVLNTPLLTSKIMKGCPNTIGVTCSRSRINYRMGPFWENQFFVFWGAPKNFFEPPKPYLALPHFWGVILLKLFDPGHGFGNNFFKYTYFEIYNLKTIALLVTYLQNQIKYHYSLPLYHLPQVFALQMCQQSCWYTQILFESFPNF